MTTNDLAHELGASPPQDFATLDEAELGQLVELLRTAREHQSAALAAAIDNGLGFIPRLARGTIKRALFG